MQGRSIGKGRAGGNGGKCCLSARLIKGRKYKLRIRLYDSRVEGDTVVMMW